MLIKGMTYKQYVNRLSKPPMDKLLKTAKNDLVKESTSRGWNRFREGIETNKLSETRGIIFVNNAVVEGSSGFQSTKNKPTNKQIGGWLQYGTDEHGPKTAKVLSWISGGVRVFAKKVKGIKASNWWGLKPYMVTKLNNIAKDWVKISKNG